MATDKMAQTLRSTGSGQSAIDTGLRERLDAARQRGIITQAGQIPSGKLSTRLRRRFKSPQTTTQQIKISPEQQAAATEAAINLTGLSVEEAARLLGYGTGTMRRGNIPSRGTANLSDILIYLKSKEFPAVELVSFYKTEGGARSDGETGYVAGKLLAGTGVESLSPEVKSWYETERTKYDDIMAKVKERIDNNIAKLKASGKEYESSDIVRIRLNAYPNWHDKNQSYKQQLKKAVAYEDRIAAWKAEQAKYKTVEVTDISIDVTPDELATVQSEQASGESCPGTIETYKLTLKNGTVILVKALDDPAKEQDGEDLARKKAEAAGYKVAWVSKKFEGETAAYKQKPSEFEPVSISKYTFTLPSGKEKTFEAMTLAEAEANAKKWGADVSTLQEVSSRTLSGYEITQALQGAASASPITYARALEKYGQVEKGSVPVRTSEGIVFFSPDMIDHLETLPSYEETSGSKEDKLIGAYSAFTGALATAKDFIITEVISPPMHGTAAAAEVEAGGVRLMRATDEEVAEAEAAEAEAAERGWTCYTSIKTFKAVLSDGSIMYVEALDSPKKEGNASVKDKLKEMGFGGAFVTKVTVPEGGWETVNTIDVPALVQEVGNSTAVDTLKNIGVTNATELVENVGALDTIADKVDGYKETNPETGKVSVNYTDLQADIEKANTDIENYVAGKDEEGNNTYDLTAAVDGGMTEKELKLAGFEKEDIDRAEDAVKTAEATGVALPGKIEWENVITGKVLPEKDFKALVLDFEAKRDKLIAEGRMYSEEWDALGQHPRDIYHLTAPSGKRVIVSATSTVFFSPARVLLPEVRLNDISKLEWAIGGAQLATWTMPFLPAKGIVGKAISTAASAGAGSIFGYGLAQTWDKLPTQWKVIGVVGTLAVSAPAIYRLGGLAFRAGRAAYRLAGRAVQGTTRLVRQIHAGETGYATIQKPPAPAAKPLKMPTVITKELPYTRAQYEAVGEALKALQQRNRLKQALAAVEQKAAQIARYTRARTTSGAAKLPQWKYPSRVGTRELTREEWIRLWKPAPSESAAQAFYRGTLPSYAEIIAAGLPEPAKWKPVKLVWAPGVSDIPTPISYAQAAGLSRLSSAEWAKFFGSVVPKAIPVGIQAGAMAGVLLGISTQAAAASALNAYNQAIASGETETKAMQKAKVAAQTTIQNSTSALNKIEPLNKSLTSTQIQILSQLSTQPLANTSLQAALKTLLEPETEAKAEELQEQQQKTLIRTPYTTEYYPKEETGKGGDTDRFWWRRAKGGQKERVSVGGANIIVKAKLNGRDWEGAVRYSLVGRRNKIIGTRVKAIHRDILPDQYTLKYHGGAPIGTVDMHISPNRTKSVGEGEQISYTIEFSTKPIFVKVSGTRPSLQVALPTVKGIGGVMSADVEDVHTPLGVKQVSPISQTEEVQVGVRKLTPGEYAEKHGSHSTYVVRSVEPLPVEELSAQEYAGLKPSKIDPKLWKKFARDREGVELLGEPEETLLPFGIKDARTVTRRIRVSGIPRGSEAVVTRKMGSKAKRAVYGWNSRYYLGHELPGSEVGATL